MASASSTTSSAQSAARPTTLSCSGSPAAPAAPSSRLTGLAYEIGPLSFDTKGYVEGLPKLMYNQDSWTKVSNVIFLDSPVGAGFSYSDTEQGFKSSDTKAVNQILIFLKKWFDEHPEFSSNPLYIAGDSYSGKIVPTVTSEIARGKEDGHGPSFNLKGYLVGNPVTDPKFDDPSKVPFAHGMGIISDEIYESYKKSCSVGDNSHQSIECMNSLYAINECLKGICPNHVLEPLCTFASPHAHKLDTTPKLSSGPREMLQLQEYTADAELKLSEISLQCRTAGYIMSSTWANNASVREALGIHKGTVPSWTRCNYSIPETAAPAWQAQVWSRVASRRGTSTAAWWEALDGGAVGGPRRRRGREEGDVYGGGEEGDVDGGAEGGWRRWRRRGAGWYVGGGGLRDGLFLFFYNLLIIIFL